MDGRIARLYLQRFFQLLDAFGAFPGFVGVLRLVHERFDLLLLLVVDAMNAAQRVAAGHDSFGIHVFVSRLDQLFLLLQSLGVGDELFDLGLSLLGLRLELLFIGFVFLRRRRRERWNNQQDHTDKAHDFHGSSLRQRWKSVIARRPPRPSQPHGCRVYKESPISTEIMRHSPGAVSIARASAKARSWCAKK